MSRLGAKIEFRTLCEVLENILKLKGPKQKFEELRKFLQNCRELGSKLKSENEDAVSFLRDSQRQLIILSF